jgi:secretion/DNA translocation related TadE-like protein
VMAGGGGRAANARERSAGTRSRADEAGAGTVLAVAMMGVLVTFTVAASGVVGVVAGHRRAQSAADLAALAGAGALQEGGDACQHAGAIARRNGARLRGCEVDGWNVAVTVAATVRLPGSPIELEARGRAGPVDGA